MTLTALLTACNSSRSISFSSYYSYDQSAPLHTSIRPVSTDSEAFRTFEIRYSSVHRQEVTGLLSYPEEGSSPFPVVILIHGLGDHKAVDYIAGGEQLLLAAGYAVLRIDLYNHGDREFSDYDFSFDGASRYRTRDVITQSVFDLRRAIDFIGSVPELDADRVGYLGISLGGIIGTIFAGTDSRVKVPVILLAGGRLNLIRGTRALTKDNLHYFGIMDPIHFVSGISPRPLLMINAQNDEVVPPATSRFLYKKARKPKNIIWYDATHKTIPVEEAYTRGIEWFDTYL